MQESVFVEWKENEGADWEGGVKDVRRGEEERKKHWTIGMKWTVVKASASLSIKQSGGDDLLLQGEQGLCSVCILYVFWWSCGPYRGVFLKREIMIILRLGWSGWSIQIETSDSQNVPFFPFTIGSVIINSLSLLPLHSLIHILFISPCCPSLSISARTFRSLLLHLFLLHFPRHPLHPPFSPLTVPLSSLEPNQDRSLFPFPDAGGVGNRAAARGSLLSNWLVPCSPNGWAGQVSARAQQYAWHSHLSCIGLCVYSCQDAVLAPIPTLYLFTQHLGLGGGGNTGTKWLPLSLHCCLSEWRRRRLILPMRNEMMQVLESALYVQTVEEMSVCKDDGFRSSLLNLFMAISDLKKDKTYHDFLLSLFKDIICNISALKFLNDICYIFGWVHTQSSQVSITTV